MNSLIGPEKKKQTETLKCFESEPKQQGRKIQFPTIQMVTANTYVLNLKKKKSVYFCPYANI